MKRATDPPIVIVAGPTASGKSALALRLAESFDGIVINADSMQVYRDLAILTARPGPEAMARAPHQLYGVIDAAESCSVGHWRGLALAEIAGARAAGRLPILTGGSGLYIRALTEGLAEVPPVPPAAREAARALHAELGGARFHALPAAHDPAAAARIAPADRQRLLRAYGVVTATGRSLSEWQNRAVQTGLPALVVVLMPPRAVLYAAADARFLAMLEQGAVEEVRALLARRLDPGLPAMKAVGVGEIAAWLTGRLGREAAVVAAQQATRQYAKRQMTWLRHKMPESERLRKFSIDAQFSESLLPEIFSFIRQFRLTAAI